MEPGGQFFFFGAALGSPSESATNPIGMTILQWRRICQRAHCAQQETWQAQQHPQTPFLPSLSLVIGTYFLQKKNDLRPLLLCAIFFFFRFLLPRLLFSAADPHEDELLLSVFTRAKNASFSGNKASFALFGAFI